MAFSRIDVSKWYENIMKNNGLNGFAVSRYELVVFI